MISLLELQRGLRQALIEDAAAPGAAAALAAIAEDGWTAADRLDVHRNNVFVSLTQVLAAAFPVVSRLVDERFFAYAADSFIRRLPPARPCLAEYGRRFPDFLGAFPPCRELVYLADTARLEWALHESAHAPEAAALSPDVLARVAPAETPHLVFDLRPSVRYLASRWPVDRIWRANQPSADGEAVDLASGPARLEVRRTAEGVEMRRLAPDEFAFREGLARGLTLGAAAETAVAVTPAFDLAAALAAVFEEGALVKVTLDDAVSP
jgi:hypothetical protein